MTGDAAAIRGVVGPRLRRRWRTLIACGLLIGVVGGVAVAAASSARRTSTAYDRLLAASNFPDALVQLTDPAPGMVDELADAPMVERAVDSMFLVGRDRSARNHVLVPVQAALEPIADLHVVRGRLADPAAVDEVVLSERFAGLLSLGVGDVFPFQALSPDEFSDLLGDRWEGTASGPAVDLRVVGMTRVPTDVVLTEFPTLVGTPAFRSLMTSDSSSGSTPSGSTAVGVWLHLRPSAEVAALADHVATLYGDGDPVDITDFGSQRRSVDDAVNVLVSGIAALAVVVAGVAMVVAAQLAARRVDDDSGDRRVLRALGLTRRAVWASATVPGLVVAVVAGVSSAAVAGALSSLSPVGVARAIEPSPGGELNVAVVGLGAALVLLATMVAWAVVAHRATARDRRPPPVTGVLPVRGWRPVRATGPGPSIAMAMALGRRRSSTSRVSLGAMVIGVAGIVAATVFGASLERMTTEPTRWGWPADHSVELPEPVRDETIARLDRADAVEGYAVVGGSVLHVAGRRVDAYEVDVRKGSVRPTMLQGRAPATADEIALGPRLLDALGLSVGDVAPVDVVRPVDGADGTRPMRIVGAALTFGLSDRSGHVDGALLAPDVAHVDFHTALVEFADGVGPSAADDLYGDLEYGGVVRPAEVSNLAAIAAIPRLVVGVLVLLALAAAVQTAISLASDGRHDLAVLRAAGLSRRTAIRAVVGAFSMRIAVALVVGLPVGLVVGRTSWSAVAASTALATDPDLPTALILVVPGSAAVAAICGALAGRAAVRRPLAGVLRAE